jgi:predicted TIM-barrel fold metal-dependent hydrolase
MAQEMPSRIGPVVDCNVHLWDQRDNPVFWLSDRTLVRDMLGDYDSLPDRYALPDYRRETAGYDVRGVIWSDAGAADPLAAADWVNGQRDGVLPVIAMVTLGDRPWRASPTWSRAARSGRSSAASGSAWCRNCPGRLARSRPWWRRPRRAYGPPRRLAASGNMATRIDALGTIFGDWTLAQIRPWLLEVAGTFGPQRCMLGSGLPIENLRSGFGSLYAAYDAIFSAFSDDDRAWLFHRTAERWYADATAAGG